MTYRSSLALFSVLLLAACAEDEPEVGVEDCRNGADDDGDGLADCDDDECASVCVEICDNGTDDDGNGLADCADSACFSQACDEVCTDGLDNDLDGLADCDDNDCQGQCPEACDDNVDNDGDGVADCADPDCESTCDADGDGYFSAAVGYDDCDDANPDINPAANEVCNEVDDDCDGLVDDDDTDLRGNAMWYRDDDGDGYGRGEEGLLTCEPPPGLAPTNDDCNDANADINPGAVEVCNGRDDNCDTLVDADDPAIDPASIRTWRVDADGDGYGDIDDPGVTACDPPTAGLVSLGDDCDDTERRVNPGNVERICDGIDNDCDPLTIDDDGLDSDADGFTVCDGDCDDNEALAFPGGVEVTCTGIDEDCQPQTPDEPDEDNDGFSTCGEDCDDTRPGVNPGAVERTCNGLDDDCDPVGTPDDPGIDADGDSYTVCLGDCDDNDPTVNPAGVEVTCTGVDEDCDPSTPDEIDVDRDGASLCDGDCDDADPSVRPGRPERSCDGLDNDCDPLTLDNPDDDGDGYAVCTDDCDDTEAFVNPGVIELPCNFIDDDCNPATPDEIDADGDGLSCYLDCDDTDPATQLYSWGRDTDGDGAARPPFVEGCDQPSQNLILVVGEEDCDDADPARFPANQEVCGDGIDQDCDGDDYAPCDTGAAMVVSGEAALDFAAGRWEGIETLEVTGLASGHTFCAWSWEALDHASSPATGPSPVDPTTCSDPDGNPCTFAFAVHRSAGMELDGDCAPFAPGVSPTPETLGYGYTTAYTIGGVDYGPGFLYTDPVSGEWIRTDLPFTVSPTGEVTYGRDLGTVAAPY